MSCYDRHPDDPFEIDDLPFMEIDDKGGRIGRFYWTNQFTVRCIHFPTGKICHLEEPGSCALVSTWGQWRRWLLS